MEVLYRLPDIALEEVHGDDDPRLQQLQRQFILTFRILKLTQPRLHPLRTHRIHHNLNKPSLEPRIVLREDIRRPVHHRSKLGLVLPHEDHQPVVELGCHAGTQVVRLFHLEVALEELVLGTHEVVDLRDDRL